jgi:hypothetical protein
VQRAGKFIQNQRRCVDGDAAGRYSVEEVRREFGARLISEVETNSD